MDSQSHAGEAHAEHHGLSVGGYTAVMVALLIGTAVTYWSAHIDLGWLNLPLALTIAFTKATLVCMFFMHLWGDSRVNQFIVIISVLFIGLMIGLTMLDVNTRYPLAAPPNSERAKVSPTGQLL